MIRLDFKIEDKKQRLLFDGIFFVLISLLTWHQLEFSCVYGSIWGCFRMEPKYIILNVLTVSAAIIILYIILNKLWLACLIFSCMTTVISLVNYHVIRFKGAPLSVIELYNFRTAMNVIGSYKFRLDVYTIGILLLSLVCFALCFVAKKVQSPPSLAWKKVLLRDLVFLVMCALLGYIGYVSPSAVKPRNTVTWLWSEAYHTYGYVACSLEVVDSIKNGVAKPDGYSTEALRDINIPKKDSQAAGRSSTPDIILILNESFYDLTQAADITTDVPYLENIGRMKDMGSIASGYAVVTNVGGGTNCSEYELLTSNSLQLMPGITPFSVLNMNGANSIVSHLEQLGYTTLASHSESEQNYSRGRAYPDIGFDVSYFHADFTDLESDGQRWPTDESLYRNIITWYHEMPEQSPRFLYLLTIQNHGDWNSNPPEMDTVHAREDYGEYAGEVNEFLSSIRLSDIAFKDLTDYFLSVDRPVVICMVGDHAPSFAKDIADSSYTDSEREIMLRSVPFVIWSNYDVEKTVPERISLNYLLPLVLNIAGVNTSPYYEYMIALSERVPIITSYGVYRDRDGNEYAYASDTDYMDEVTGYFYLEYNNLSHDRMQYLFDAYD